MMLRAQRLTVTDVQESPAVPSLDDVIGVEPDTAAAALRVASGPLAAPVRYPEDGEAPSTVLGGEKLGIGVLRRRARGPGVDGAE